MEIKIDIVGCVSVNSGETWSEKKSAKNYPNGEGLYAMVDDGHYVGLRAVYEKKTDSKGEETYSIGEFLFPPKTIAEMAVEECAVDIREVLRDSCDKLHEAINKCIAKVELASGKIDGMADWVSEDMKIAHDALKRIADNGEKGNTVSEGTLLAALNIVTKGKGGE